MLAIPKDEKNIFLYWECKQGCKKPEYLDLCLETIKKHNPDISIYVLDEISVRELLPDLRNDYEFNDLCIAHKTDYIRSRLLYKYGGVS